MLVLVINSGSSSLKYQVRDVEAGSVLTEGLVEKIGMGTGGEGDGQIEGPRDHAEALEQVDAAIHDALGGPRSWTPWATAWCTAGSASPSRCWSTTRSPGPSNG